MTLFTTLLVLIFERLFKLGEHWQLDHRLEAFFRRVKHFSLGRTLCMTIIAMGVTFFTVTRIAGSIVQRSHAAGVAADWFAVYWRR